jgi:hypothetical protein
MRPDRVMVGEVRDAAALDMLQAMNTGHDGSMSTIHANSARDAFSRLETMVMTGSSDIPLPAVRAQIGSALNIVIQQARLPDGSRRIIQVAEVTGYAGELPVLSDIFRFHRTDDGVTVFEPTGAFPRSLAKVNFYGFEVAPEIFTSGPYEVKPKAEQAVPTAVDEVPVDEAPAAPPGEGALPPPAPLPAQAPPAQLADVAATEGAALPVEGATPPAEYAPPELAMASEAGGDPAAGVYQSAQPAVPLEQVEPAAGATPEPAASATPEPADYATVEGTPSEEVTPALPTGLATPKPPAGVGGLRRRMKQRQTPSEGDRPADTLRSRIAQTLGGFRSDPSGTKS